MQLRLCAIFALCLLAVRPVYALEFDDFLLGRPLSTTLQPADSVPVVQGGATRQWFPASSFMRLDGSNASLPDARTRILPTPTLNNCLMGTGTDWASASCPGAGGMAMDASNATLPTALTNLGLGTTDRPTLSGLNLAAPNTAGLLDGTFGRFSYGSAGAPFPTDPTYGGAGIASYIYATMGTGVAHAITSGASFHTHLSAGTKGVANGITAIAYNDGTWLPDGIQGGAAGVWAVAKGSRGGALYGLFAKAHADGLDVGLGGAAGIEVDTAITVPTDAKWGIAIVSTDYDTGPVTGTTLVEGSGAVIPKSAALGIINGGIDATGYHFGITTVMGAGGLPPIPAVGSLWRSGGYTVTHGLDWPDMTFSGNAINLPGFNVDGVGRLRLVRAVAGGGQSTVITVKNTAAADNTKLSIGGENYAGVVESRIDFIMNALSNVWTGMAFLTNSGAGIQENARFAVGTGNFLIGTTTDCSQKLCVQGTVNVTGAVNDAGAAPTGTAGSGYVRATAPTITNATLVTPTLGVASATSITGLTTPSAASDAVNKGYADSIAAGIVTHAAVEAASTANLTATASGTGPGKTLTNSGAQAAFALDGVAGVLNARYGVKDQTLTQNNGIYTLTTVGTGATNWVLTRATDFDAASASEVAAGASFIAIAGTANAATQWVETGQGPFTLETTPIIFSKVTSGGGSGTVNAGTISQFGVYQSAGSAISGQSFTGLMKGNGASAPGVYGGTSCTNQFPRSLDLNGAATCATVGTSDLASSLSLTTPTITGGAATGLTGLAIRDTSAAFDLTIAAVSDPILTAGRVLTIDMSDVAHTLDLGTMANTITFPSTISYNVIGSGDTGTVTNTMLAGSIATSKLVGTVANDDALAGVPGEFLSATGTAVAVTTTTQVNITSLALTAGDWDVSGNIKFNPAATTTSTLRAGGLSTTSATLPTSISVSQSVARESGAITAGQLGWTAALGTVRVSTAGTPTVYCVGRFTFATSTATADCVISARRVR